MIQIKENLIKLIITGTHIIASRINLLPGTKDRHDGLNHLSID